MPPAKAQKRKKPVEEEEEDEDSQEVMDMSDEEGSLRIDGIYIPPPPKPACTFEANGSRLIITGINNYFFKSYAKEQKLGPFHKCFNAIVGPNGSGKSNVIDAMLFVFGYRASKIRSKKISVLLHNSEHYPNVQSCTVSVHFAVIIDKEGDAYDIVPKSEFVVSRTANKDNSSYYQINGQRSQFKDVAKLLRNYGIDLDHNRFLILQGEVEQIAMMKCKAQNEHETGMLEYLEDIIGTSRFKVPLVQLEERVEILADQRAEKLNRVKLVEKELNELKKPMEEAVEFLQLENTIVTRKNFLYQWHVHDLDEKIKQTEEEKSEVAVAQKELADQLASLHTEKASKESILKEASKKYEGLEKRRDKIKEAFDVANNKDIQLQADMTQLNKTRKKTKELLNEERKKLADLQRVPEENEKGIVECEAKEQQMSGKKEKLEADKTKLLANLRSETQGLQEQKEVLQTDLVELNKVVDETKSAYTLAESELKIYVSNEENEKQKLITLQTTYETVKQTMTERNHEVKEIRKKVPLTEKSLKEAKDDLSAVKVREAELINEIRKKRTSLAETKSSMQASRSRGRVLDSLVQQKREGNCPGLFGRLGDLGAIEQKYDVAVSTACGPLDNIVVDTVSTAQWCIQFLKEHDIGRATFIALEKQEHLRERANSTIKTPENVPRLFDLIRIEDDRIRPAFYYALRDTLVAKDLDQASRIAYGAQRYRVVTLAGQLIETTGTMSGGGKTVCRGRMGQSVRVSTSNPKDIEHMEQELENMDEQIRKLRQKQATFESQINTLEPELKQMKINLEKFSIELQSSKEQEPLLAKQLKVQEAKSNSTRADPVVVKKLTKTVNELKTKYEDAAAVAGEKQAEVDLLTAKIKEKTTGKMKAMDKNLKEVTNTIDKCKAEITRLRVGMKTAERNAKKSSEKIATMEQDITDAENKLRQWKTQREEIENDAQQLLRSIENIAGQLTEAEEEFAGVKGEVADLTKRENQIKSDKIEVDQKCKTYDRTINEKKGEIHQWRAKLKQLKLQDVPDQSMEELKTYSAEELTERDIQNVQRELNYNEEKLKSAKPNLTAITEYRKKQLVFIERSNELDELSQKKAKVKEALDNVRQKRKEEFVTGYNIIRLKLKEMYQMITLGGDADFEMVDTFDPFTEGIQFNVRPPKKSWKNISNLSGGEKTLSSLALVFALHYYKPSPLYVMDEIDAALDFKNVSIVANYIKERTKNAQFIIISLRPNMFELCDYLIGIFKTYSCTKSICIDPRQYENKQPVQMTQQTQNIPRTVASEAQNCAEIQNSTNMEANKKNSTHAKNSDVESNSKTLDGSRSDDNEDEDEEEMDVSKSDSDSTVVESSLVEDSPTQPLQMEVDTCT